MNDIENCEFLRRIEEELGSVVDEKRLLHILSTRDTALETAKMFCGFGEEIDLFKVEQAALLHDVTKCMNQEELCRRYGISLSEQDRNSPAVLHALTGAYYAREVYGVSDEVFSAIKNHTLGQPGMPLLDKIIFVSDYCEETRTYEKCRIARKKVFEIKEKVALCVNGDKRQVALSLFDRVILEILESTVEHLIKKEKSVHSGTLCALEHFRNVVRKDTESL